MTERNGLYKISAAGAVLVGTFLLLGAAGHIQAVAPILEGVDGMAETLALLLPGSILALSGVVTVSLCVGLWEGKRWAYDGAVGVSTLLLGYLVYLLAVGVPNHPVALFTTIVSCHFVVLLVTRLGLVWPADRQG